MKALTSTSEVAQITVSHTYASDQLVTFNSGNLEFNCTRNLIHDEGISIVFLPCQPTNIDLEVIANNLSYLNSSYPNSSYLNSTSFFTNITLPLWHVALFGSLACFVDILTIGGNLIVLMSFVLERSIRQPTNYFIASLAVSDLLIGLLSMPFYTVYLLSGKQWVLGEQLCDLWLSIDYTACLCSIYTVFCITADRFCSVKIPAKYRRWRTERKVLTIIALTWIFPFTVFFPSIFGWQYFVGKRTVPTGMCYVQYMDDEVFNCILQVCYFWITLATMIFLYAGIYRVALDLHRRSLAQKEKTMSCLVSMAGRTVTQIGSVMSMPRRPNPSIDAGDRQPPSDLENLANSSQVQSTRIAANRLLNSDSNNKHLETQTQISKTGCSCSIGTGAVANESKFKHKNAKNAASAQIIAPALKSRRITRTTSECKPEFKPYSYRNSSRIQRLNTYDEAIEMQHLPHFCNRSLRNSSTNDDIFAQPLTKNLYCYHAAGDVSDCLTISSTAAFAVAASPEMLHDLYYADDDDDDDVDLRNACISNRDSASISLLRNKSNESRLITTRGQTVSSTSSVLINLEDCSDDGNECITGDTENCFHISNCTSVLTPPVFEETVKADGNCKSSGMFVSPNNNVYMSNMQDKTLKLNHFDSYRKTLLSSGSTMTTYLSQKSAELDGKSASTQRNISYDEWNTDDENDPRSPDLCLGVKDSGIEKDRPHSSETDSELLQSEQNKNKTRHVTKYVFKRERSERSTDTSSTTTRATTMASQLAHSNNRTRKALRTITIILGAFSVCWIPWHVLSMIIGFCKEREPSYCVKPILYDISYWLCYLNSPINPFCYAFANQQFKKTFVRLLKFDWRTF